MFPSTLWISHSWSVPGYVLVVYLRVFYFKPFVTCSWPQNSRAISLRHKALSSIILSLGGTEATGIVKFLLDSFGGSEVYEDAKRQILAHAPLPEDLEEGLLDDDEERSKKLHPQPALA